jgi:uncharacterized protein YjbI with pentapeptide repeats
MADKAHLAIVKLGSREKWQLFRADFSVIMPNLIGADLSSADLSGYNLFSALLIGSNLSGADLSGADLNGAQLAGADLSHANFSRANLECANLAGANLNNTNFENCLMGGVTFQRNDLSNCLGLDTITVELPASIDYPTLKTTENLPIDFLQKLGFPESFIRCLIEWG